MAFFSHHQLQQPHPAAPPPPQQPVPPSFRNALPVPVDGQIPAPLAFFNPPPAFPDQAAQPQLVEAVGLTAAAGLGWRQPREQELLGENSQMSSIDFLQTGSAVSTGLALSLEDRRHGGVAGTGNSSGDSPLLLLPMLDDDISREVQRLDADMDRFIKAQSERLRRSILEKVQAKQYEALASVEDKIVQKIRDKEAEVENINKRNSELEDQIKQLAVEVGAWQQRVKYNESMINALKYNLEKVCAHQSKDFKERCGDSEVDDTASCCNGGAVNLQLMSKENRHPKYLTACRVCKSSDKIASSPGYHPPTPTSIAGVDRDGLLLVPPRGCDHDPLDQRVPRRTAAASAVPVGRVRGRAGVRALRRQLPLRPPIDAPAASLGRASVGCGHRRLGPLDLSGLDIAAALDQILDQAGLTNAMRGECWLLKYLEEAEFGPDAGEVSIRCTSSGQWRQNRRQRKSRVNGCPRNVLPICFLTRSPVVLA